MTSNVIVNTLGMLARRLDDHIDLTVGDAARRRGSRHHPEYEAPLTARSRRRHQPHLSGIRQPSHAGGGLWHFGDLAPGESMYLVMEVSLTLAALLSAYVSREGDTRISTNGTTTAMGRSMSAPFRDGETCADGSECYGRHCDQDGNFEVVRRTSPTASLLSRQTYGATCDSDHLALDFETGRAHAATPKVFMLLVRPSRRRCTSATCYSSPTSAVTSTTRARATGIGVVTDECAIGLLRREHLRLGAAEVREEVVAHGGERDPRFVMKPVSKADLRPRVDRECTPSSAHSANFFDTKYDCADGCEDGCPVLASGTSSLLDASTCTSGTCESA